jgi:hypothetical protein
LTGIGDLAAIPQLTGIGDEDDMGDLVGLSSQPGGADEGILYHTHELFGFFYVAVVPQTLQALGQPFTLSVDLAEAPTAFPVVTAEVDTTFASPTPDANVQTLILTNLSRMRQLYPSDPATTTLPSLLNTLAASEDVHGVVLDLGTYPSIADAYVAWDEDAQNPQAADYVARSIKALINTQAMAYSNLKYMVIVGDDEIVPFRRIRDEAAISNERKYAEGIGIDTDSKLFSTLANRYFLSDDYYAGLLPIPWNSREVYLPQLALGRLVETPSEITRYVNTFRADPEVAPTSAYVAGYDFLNDLATVISTTLDARGIQSATTLINDTWTAQEFRTTYFGPPASPNPRAPGITSLNAHFAHNSLGASDSSSVFAMEVLTPTDYTGALVFSVGCHSGFNLPDGEARTMLSAIDWAQSFTRRGATFLGNTGYAYGDSDLVAYTEQLMAYVFDELGPGPEGVGTVGEAVMQAKQRYYNRLVGGNPSNYDEKAMAEMIVYGMPMLRVRMPIPRTPTPQVTPAPNDTYAFNLSYDTHNVAGGGTYYTVQGSSEAYVLGERPVEPYLSQEITSTAGTMIHGVLMEGGTFSDTLNLDPLISTVMTAGMSVGPRVESTYPIDRWFPGMPGTLNRFLTIDGKQHQRLVVVPGQFQATSSTNTTIGTQRLYSSLRFKAYTAPLGTADFRGPAIYLVQAVPGGGNVQFRVQVSDDSGSLQRVLVLYAYADNPPGTPTSWIPVELTYNPVTGLASAPPMPFTRPIYFFAQAVDPAGNVTLGLDHGNPYYAGPSGPAPDTTAPFVTAVLSGTLGTNGWHTGPVEVRWLVTDYQSVITSRTGCGTTTLAADTVGTSLTCSATSAAGTSSNTITVRVDSTPPSVTINGPANNATYTLGSQPAPTCSASDSGGSGLMAPCAGTLAGGRPNGVGTYTYSVTVRDNAGNTTTRVAAYGVLYGWEGFQSPINDPANPITVKNAGSTLPAKFQLKRANGTTVLANSAPVWLTPARGPAIGTPIDPNAQYTQAPSGITVPLTGNKYHYNWNTLRSQAGYYWRIGVQLDDGTTHFVMIGLR